MYEYINKEYGNGEYFHVINVKTDTIKEAERQRVSDSGIVRKSYKILGKKAYFIGYFDSQEELYEICFAKYLEEQSIYKDGEAGNIICITVNTNYTKEEYLKKGEY